MIQSSKVLLGGINATEPVLKGDTTINLLNELVDQLTRLSQALQTSTDPAVNLAAQALTPWLINYGTRLGTAKSNVTTTL